MNVRNIIVIGIMSITLLFSATYFNLLQKNNIDVSPASNLEIQLALNNSINWVLSNQKELLKINNPVLWWFLDESATLINNNELANFVKEYKDTVLEKNTIWVGYWIKRPPFLYLPGSLDYMENYQKFFAYALSCDTDLGEEDFIKMQLNSKFCDWSPYYSSCITHQMMAVRLLQIKGCGDQRANSELSNELANKIQKQLTWDPRVGDVYIQRVLMLVDSGNRAKVKPVWIKHILAEQRDSGGWASFYRLFNITNNTEFGYGYKFPEVRSSVDVNFHSTAQAIYLLSLLAKNQS